MRQAVLFDVDGTLIDSNYLHVGAWMRAFRQVGHPVDGAAIHRAIGMGSSQLLERLLGEELAAKVGEEVREAHTRLYRQDFPMLRPFAGAREVLFAVARRAQVVLATSASPQEVEALCAALDADDAIAAVTGGGDVEAAKPEPDLVASALERAGVGASQAIFVGDTVWDVEAASRAGVPCLTVLTGGIGAAELTAAGAAAVYDSVADLRDRLDEVLGG
ncbi:MAG TPA: HAD family hydrolase [Acidimicrobiales bacterium]|jgi:HAD superfamily hydrolase (TIGR01509 family)|nr:HAD family hydrolase [Acidimicrobiales bacterium]